MNRRFTAWATVLIVSLVMSGLCLRWLAVQGVPLGENLIGRGAGCLLFVFLFAVRRRLSLIPRSLKKQFLRALIAGLALTFLTLSYNWLTASAVSVLSRMDVPLLVVLGPLIGVQASRRTRLMALFSISFLIWYVSSLEVHGHLLFGLASLTAGTLLLCYGYWFIKKSMSEENEAVTILVPSLAIIFFGLIQPGAGFVHWTPLLFVVSLISGASMFGAYYATMRLYEQTDLASAEFPTLISSIVIQPFEMIFLGVPMHASYLLSSVGFVVAIYFILSYQNREVVGV